MTVAMRPYNVTWYLFLLVIVFIGIGLYLALRYRQPLTQRRVMGTVAIANVMLYTAFTFQSILNPDLPQVTLAQNLPFHLCQVVAFGLIAAYFFEWGWLSQQLRLFLFYIGTITGTLATTSPVPYYVDRAFYSLAAIGFYGVHSMNAVMSILLAVFGLYKPKYRDAVRAIIYLLLLATLVLFLDIAMRAWIDPNVNYFYIFSPEGAGILAMLYNILPIPFLYIFLVVPIALVGVPLVLVVYRGIERLVKAASSASPVRDPQGASATP